MGYWVMYKAQDK
jgi:hypothetical protein